MKSPNIPALTDCARSLAREGDFPAPSDELIRNKLDYVLIERKNWECFEAHLITSQELLDLVLSHLQMLIRPDASWPISEPLRVAFRKALNI